MTPYSCLARGDWVLKWRERAQFCNWYVNFHYVGEQLTRSVFNEFSTVNFSENWLNVRV